MNTEELRKQQAVEGRNREERPVTIKGKGKTRFSVAKGHDAKLKSFQDAKTVVEVALISGAAYVGLISDRDKYTISVLIGELEVTLYKHAIESFMKAPVS